MKYPLTLICFFFITIASAQKKPQVVTGTQVVKMVFRDDHQELRLPVISNQYPALKVALADTALLEGRIADSIKQDFETTGSGITSFDYKVTHQNRHTISFIFYYETMGAYPDSYQTYNTYDIATGKHHDLSAELNPAGLKFVFANYKASFIKDLKYWKNPHLMHDAMGKDEVDAVINALQDYINNLIPADVFKNYVFTTKGILFTSGQLVPHAFRGVDPGKDWLVTYTQLKPYLKSKIQ